MSAGEQTLTKDCAGCGLVLHKDAFSKTQWKKRARNCTKCINRKQGSSRESPVSVMDLKLSTDSSSSTEDAPTLATKKTPQPLPSPPKKFASPANMARPGSTMAKPIPSPLAPTKPSSVEVSTPTPMNAPTPTRGNAPTPTPMNAPTPTRGNALTPVKTPTTSPNQTKPNFPAHPNLQVTSRTPPNPQGKRPTSEDAAKQAFREKLVKFYREYMPDRLQNKAKYVEKRMIAYMDRQDDLFAILKRKASKMAKEARSVVHPLKRKRAAEESSPEVPARSKKTATNCDRCDGNHESSKCPIYKKGREKHPDAQRGQGGVGMGGSGGNFLLPSARVVHQPGDGSCLFHSLKYGLKYPKGTSTLRRELASWISSNPSLKIADTPVKDWVRWDAGCSVKSYASRMSHGGWGGGIEMAACSKLKHVNVHVYEKRRGGYKRISCFDYSKSAHTVHVLYQGGVHYDALVPTSAGVRDVNHKSAAKHSSGFGNKMGSQGKRKQAAWKSGKRGFANKRRRW